METLFLAIAVSVAICMAHAAITRRWRLVEGGAPILGVAVLLAIITAV
jgi:hypothetical protein